MVETVCATVWVASVSLTVKVSIYINCAERSCMSMYGYIWLCIAPILPINGTCLCLCM